ncbi:hypothetical protein EMPG_17010 [Blastomyces silverae]|uniref:BTB domain-containing protein n=1 Tax=Blastomyces silverae TaxID=2060906 RepID=A0A0H1B7S3_9EURO|nr:hypothetical protein EMPG_17010 [Blastomyces silverae]
METAIVSGEENMDEMDQSDTEYTLSASLKSFFISSTFTDFTIQVADEEFKVHKLIICGQSEFFSRMFNTQWKETAEDVIKLEDDPRTIEAMIRFMYGFDYDGSIHGRISPMLFSVRVYVVAEFYGIPGLKDQAKTKFEAAVQTCWDMDDFPAVITEVYTTTLPTDQTLRRVLVATATEHIELLLQKDEFVRALELCGSFAADVLRRLGQNQSAGNQRHKCPNCGASWGWN